MKLGMLRYIICVFLAVTGPSLAFGADSGPSRLLGRNEVLRGSFIQDHPVKGFKRPVHSEGRFVVVPGRGVIWTIEKPLPMSFIFTSSGMVQTIGDLPLLSKSARQMPFLGRVTGLVCAALGGDTKALEPDFEIKRSGSAKLWRIKIAPRDPAEARLPFRAVTATGDTYVDHADVLRPDGLSDSFTFSEQSIGPAELTNSETRALDLGLGTRN